MTPGNLPWGQARYFDPRIFWKNFSSTHPHGIYIIIMLYSETILTVFFVIIYNRFVESSKCNSHDFDPQSKNSSRAPGQ